MGLTSVVKATLECGTCGGTYVGDVQFKTGKDYGPHYEENGRAELAEPGVYDGGVEAYCERCLSSWIPNEKAASFESLAAGVARGDIVIKRGDVVRDQRGMPVPDERDDFTIQLSTGIPLTPEEIVADGRKPQQRPGSSPSVRDEDYVIFEGEQRIHPTRITQRSNWWIRHAADVARRTRARGWRHGEQRYIDIDVVVDENHVIRLARGSTKPAEHAPGWISGRMPVMGVEIHYLRTGGGTGGSADDAKPTVIMLHGLMGSGAGWSPVARVLEADYDVILPDARGHGESAAPAEGYSYADHEEDVYGLAGRLALWPAVLVGHSMGGMTAAVMASIYKGVVRAVVLIDPTFLSPERQRKVAASDVAEQHRQTLALSKAELLARARLRSPHRSEEIREHQATARLQTSLAAFAVLTPPSPDYREVVAKIQVPILLVIGDDSPVVTLEMAEELQRINPLVRLEQVADAGHGLPFDQPDRLGEIILEFLRRLP